MNIEITRQSSPIDAARILLDQAAQVYRREPELAAEVRMHQRRLDEPVRIALVGSVKAGKSTLLNAFLGQHIAPTDARECTRVVTWYRHGSPPSVHAHALDGEVDLLPVLRQQDRLELELGHLQADKLDRLEVTWPVEPLTELILVDTPGTSSISTDISDRTREFLAPKKGVSGVDAVIYMLRSLHSSDVEFLHHFHDRTGHAGSALGLIAVLSRADELGGGRLDAMVSINRAAQSLRADPALSGLVETVVPVAGLLALASSTLRQSEFAVFEALEKVPREKFQALMVSADRFIADEDDQLPSARARAQLVDRFGLYGIRLAIASLRGGITDAPALSAELVRRSGLEELRSAIDLHFAQRSVELKAYSAVLAVQRLLSRHPRDVGRLVLETAQEYLDNSHAFCEMRLISKVRSMNLPLSAELEEELIRLVGGCGTRPFERLGMAEGTAADELVDAAHAALWKWLEIADDPLTARETVAASRVVMRSCEGIVAELMDLVAYDV